jgi:hypothetical protein
VLRLRLCGSLVLVIPDAHREQNVFGCAHYSTTSDADGIGVGKSQLKAASATCSFYKMSNTPAASNSLVAFNAPQLKEIGRELVVSHESLYRQYVLKCRNSAKAGAGEIKPVSFCITIDPELLECLVMLREIVEVEREYGLEWEQRDEDLRDVTVKSPYKNVSQVSDISLLYYFRSVARV